MESKVVNNPDEARYEVWADGELGGFAQYRSHGQRITLFHTEIDPRLEGRGLGSQLARGTLDDTRAQGIAVVPTCPFIASYIRKHPEYADLVAARDRP